MLPRTALSCLRHINEGKERSSLALSRIGRFGLVTSAGDSPLLVSHREHRALARLQNPIQAHPSPDELPGTAAKGSAPAPSGVSSKSQSAPGSCVS